MSRATRLAPVLLATPLLAGGAGRRTTDEAGELHVARSPHDQRALPLRLGAPFRPAHFQVADPQPVDPVEG